jgi:hypothetical protein
MLNAASINPASFIDRLQSIHWSSACSFICYPKSRFSITSDLLSFTQSLASHVSMWYHQLFSYTTTYNAAPSILPSILQSYTASIAPSWIARFTYTISASLIWTSSFTIHIHCKHTMQSVELQSRLWNIKNSRRKMINFRDMWNSSTQVWEKEEWIHQSVKEVHNYIMHHTLQPTNGWRSSSNSLDDKFAKLFIFYWMNISYSIETRSSTSPSLSWEFLYGAGLIRISIHGHSKAWRPTAVDSFSVGDTGVSPRYTSNSAKTKAAESMVASTVCGIEEFPNSATCFAQEKCHMLAQQWTPLNAQMRADRYA